ncbi:hypothetical protein ACIBSV_30715 [Embleya sp. NPDC050154]|uniref:MmyB family transcriptional regulator n=1 Tax=Embleya sp. NPDC050154 TaxID=3363988 RepID=UPI0037BA1334
MRLEQGRGPQPSVQVLAALAGALRLTEDERDHLYLLAGHRPPEGARAGEYLRPGLRYLLDRLEDVPVQVVSGLGDLPAQNDLALALFGCVCRVAEQERNIVLGWFTDPDAAPARHPRDGRDRTVGPGTPCRLRIIRGVCQDAELPTARGGPCRRIARAAHPTPTGHRHLEAAYGTGWTA